jgi:hypothetical protein
MQWDKSMTDSEHIRTIGFADDIKNKRALELQALGQMFISDAVRLPSMRPGQYVLFAHAIELALKAFLHNKGVTDAGLKNIRHDLASLLIEAQARGLQVTEAETAKVIGQLNDANEKAALRYDVNFSGPMAAELEFIAKALFRDAKVEVAT